jgi:hypothetical protein
MLVNGLIFIYSPSPKLTDVPVTNGLLVLHPSQTFSRRCINLQPERQARQLPLPRCSIRVSQWLFGRRLRTEGIGNNLNPSGIPPMSCANMCQLYNWGWYDPTDADFNTSTNPCHLFFLGKCPKPSCVALLWEAWAPGISKFCRHSGEFKMPWAGPPNMWRNSGYRRMETKMGPKTWLSRDYCLLFIMFP